MIEANQASTERLMRQLFPDAYREQDEHMDHFRRMLAEDRAARTVTEEEGKRLQRQGYRVRETDHGWAARTPQGMGVIRGWTATEEEAWWHCLQHSERNGS